MTQQKPTLSFWQIWNMSFGFLGIQFGFALQNANVSRIFQTLGASIDDLPILWVAAPATGLIVQPIIGYFSDRTWNSLGRRRPYFLFGAILASAALFVMPNSPTLWVAAGMLWIMDASINVSMEPFRAFVGDMLPRRQRPTGFAMQSFFIGIGAIIASALPWMLANWFGVSNDAPAGEIPQSVRLAFYLGGAVFLLAVLYTVLTTREYSPEQLAAYDGEPADSDESISHHRSKNAYLSGGLVFVALGAALAAWVGSMGLDKQLFVLAGGLGAFGLMQLAAGLLQGAGKVDNAAYRITHDLFHMPRVMRQLAWVQFFSWFALFAMWIYGTSAVTSHHYGALEATAAGYNEGADWVGVLFAVYNGFAAIAAIAIPLLVRRLGCRVSHLIHLTLGGIGLLSFYFISEPRLLMIPMIGVGIAWASILSLPYVLLAGALPARKMGVYMGIFNFFIVIPQLVAASVLALVLRELFAGRAIFGLVIGGVLMIVAGLTTMLVDAQAEPQ
jgi:maltose/moltooligosaccharide transporter